MVRIAVDNGPSTASFASRRASLAKVHVAKKALAMEEEDYRAVVERVTGKTSAGDCDQRQLDALIAEFGRMGFKPSAGAPRRAPAGGPVARKARAMWISLSQLGAIGDSSDKALDAFVERQLGVERLQWMSERQGYRLIEALKAIGERSGWDQNVSARLSRPKRIRELKDRLVAAQLAKLRAAGAAVDPAFSADRTDWTNARLEDAAAMLSIEIRLLDRGA